mmetsp:Transcript_26850/g.34633  ORF Transcript_26850/g.34633 Transcript_26850/m.34633 type:complete len:136 (+) Transcript_26850:186-593(+)
MALKEFFCQHIHPISAGFGAASLVVAGIGIGYRRQMKKVVQEEEDIRLRSKLVKEKYRSNLNFNPYQHAFKALGYGTLLCLGSSAVITMGVGYVMDVSSLSEFADKLRVVGPQKKETDGRAFRNTAKSRAREGKK